jgi:hypothetical protein
MWNEGINANEFMSSLEKEGQGLGEGRQWKDRREVVDSGTCGAQQSELRAWLCRVRSAP